MSHVYHRNDWCVFKPSCHVNCSWQCVLIKDQKISRLDEKWQDPIHYFPIRHRKCSFNGAWNSIMQIARVSFETKQIIFSEVLRWACDSLFPRWTVRAVDRTPCAWCEFSRGMFDRIHQLTQNDWRQKIWWRYDSQLLILIHWISQCDFQTILHQKEMLFSSWKKSHFQNTEVQMQI